VTASIDQRAAWVAAFVEAHHALPVIKRDKTVEVETKQGGRFSYAYADLAQILEAVGPILKDHGLAIAQEVVSDEDRVGVVTKVFHQDGWMEMFGPVYLFGGDDPQSAGSAITYARRYSLVAALGIATESDDDAVSVIRQMAAENQVSIEDPHCPACLVINGELIALTKEKTRNNRTYWRCANRGQACAGWTESNGKVYSLSLWVEDGDDPDDWQALSDRYLRSKGIYPLNQGSVGAEVVLHVRDQVARTLGITDDEEPFEYGGGGGPTMEEVNEAVYFAIPALIAEGLIDEEIVEKGAGEEDQMRKLKAMAMAIPMRLADQWIASATAFLDPDVEDREEEE
jgi:hypothetical protein